MGETKGERAAGVRGKEEWYSLSSTKICSVSHSSLLIHCQWLLQRSTPLYECEQLAWAFKRQLNRTQSPP